MIFQSYLQRNNITTNKMRRSLPAYTWNDYLRVLCITLATVSAMLAAAIVGTGIHAYHTYVFQRAANNPWWLPLWPQHFDTTGTKALIGAGAGLILVNGIFIATSFLSKVNNHTTCLTHPALTNLVQFNQSARSFLATLAGIILSTASSLIAIFSIVLTLILNRRSPQTDTIQTWTCKFKTNIPNAMVMAGGQSSNLSNDLFATLCRESVSSAFARDMRKFEANPTHRNSASTA
jgi:hypothetical protein